MGALTLVDWALPAAVRPGAARRQPGEESELVEQPVEVEQRQVLRVQLLRLDVDRPLEQARRVQGEGLGPLPRCHWKVGGREVLVVDEMGGVVVARRLRLAGGRRSAGRSGAGLVSQLTQHRCQECYQDGMHHAAAERALRS